MSAATISDAGTIERANLLPRSGIGVHGAWLVIAANSVTAAQILAILLFKLRARA